MPRIDAAGVELFYESTGEGIPLVLQAHHHLAWMTYQIPYFSQFFRVITFDRRGTGRSAVPSGDWTMADFARDAKNLLDALAIEKAIVGGASLGGAISCQFGLDYPDRALALILGHTTPYRRHLSTQWLDGEIEAIKRGEPPIQYQPRSFDWEKQGPPTADPALRGSLMSEVARTLTMPLGVSADAAIKSLLALRGWDLRPRYTELQQMRIPTLVIVGGHEPQKTIELSYEWHQQIPASEFIILPDAYHAAARQQPVAWNAAIHDFLKRHGFGLS